MGAIDTFVAGFGCACLVFGCLLFIATLVELSAAPHQKGKKNV